MHFNEPFSYLEVNIYSYTAITSHFNINTVREPKYRFCFVIKQKYVVVYYKYRALSYNIILVMQRLA